LQELRPTAFALRAFDVETSLIGDHAKGEMLVLMRCQWWRDAINAAFKGDAPEQPVLTALQEVMRHVSLTRYRLQRMISTKEEDLLRKDPLPTLSRLENVVEGTSVQLSLLQLESIGLNVEAEENVDAILAATHIGKAAGLATLLRHTARHAQKQRTYLPLDVCQRYNVHPSDVLNPATTEGLRAAVQEVAAVAQEHLNAAKRLASKVPLMAKALLLPSTAAGLYLKSLAASKYDVYDIALQHGGYSNLKYQLLLKYNLVTGSI
jgi:NADH dehydrogenase [ubiquinone] 1 alpha subcomplex assembly factor 6